MGMTTTTTIFRACMGWFFPTVWYFTICGITLYIIVPVVVKLYPKIVFEGLFLNRLCPPLKYLHLKNPEKHYKLKKTSNVYVKSSSGNSLGVWHIPPTSEYDNVGVDARSLADAEKVVVYCHGNAMHRGFLHRTKLYHNLQKIGYHVITFDYSGFGDSEGQPTPGKVVEDAISIYNWTVKQLKREDATIVLWGHSLGTFISTRALTKLIDGQARLPECLILEAPFTNILEASESFPLSKVFYMAYPYLRKDIHSAVHSFSAECATETFLPQITVPILILHAEDDHRVAFHIGEKLFKKTMSDPETKSSFIRFIRMHERHDVKHYTATHPEIASIFQEFMEEVKSSKSKGPEPRSRDRFELVEI